MDVVEDDIRLFQVAVRDYSAYDFSEYSIKSLRRRLTKILQEFDMDMNGLVSKLRTDQNFLEEIVKKVTVTTTELFRDPEMWKQLRDRILPDFNKKDSINIWHPGCSTGQEVYSMMILLHEAGLFNRSNIYASDLNSDALKAAREGRYKFRFNKSYLENFDRSLNFSRSNDARVRNIHWSKYFNIDQTRDIIEMKEYLKKKPVFIKSDLVRDNDHFFVNFDLIICRNVIIYFNIELQNKVFNLFHRSMNDGGYLVLGPHESILGPFANRFVKDGHFYFKK